jgi:hypothetical protein
MPSCEESLVKCWWRGQIQPCSTLFQVQSSCYVLLERSDSALLHSVPGTIFLLCAAGEVRFSPAPHCSKYNLLAMCCWRGQIQPCFIPFQVQSSCYVLLERSDSALLHSVPGTIFLLCAAGEVRFSPAPLCSRYNLLAMCCWRGQIQPGSTYIQVQFSSPCAKIL